MTEVPDALRGLVEQWRKEAEEGRRGLAALAGAGAPFSYQIMVATILRTERDANALEAALTAASAGAQPDMVMVCPHDHAPCEAAHLLRPRSEFPELATTSDAPLPRGRGEAPADEVLLSGRCGFCEARLVWKRREDRIHCAAECVLFTKRAPYQVERVELAAASLPSAAGAPELRCQHCGEEIRLIDGEWLDRETHTTCCVLDGDGLPRTDTPKHAPLEQSEESAIVTAVTAIVREADQDFQRVGGSSRHWTRDCFLPLLNRAGYLIQPTAAGGRPQPDALDLTVNDVHAINVVLQRAAPTADGTAEQAERQRLVDLMWKLTLLGQRIESTQKPAAARPSAETLDLWTLWKWPADWLGAGSTLVGIALSKSDAEAWRKANAADYMTCFEIRQAKIVAGHGSVAAQEK